MIDRNTAEQAYCFFHQKWRVYSGKSSETQRDDIEYAINSYLEGMSPDLYALLSGGRSGFLREHPTFSQDMLSALSQLEEMLQ